MFGRSSDNLVSEDGILKYLTLPGLQVLFLSMSDISGNDLISFLERSSPPLRDLTIGEGCRYLDFPLLEQCLRLLTTLTHLEFYGPYVDLVQGLYATLVDSPSSVFPRLHSLCIPYHNGCIAKSAWVALQRALSLRRTHFASVNIIFSADCSYTPSGLNAELCAAFGQLAEDGMEIHIGSGTENFISVQPTGE
ncbi:hypothetical protein DFH07DRAFT_457413 [Mycena maculata]|uniref:Uncharacterized protein n=1 Tax=Mycena maculata TaxID=230809 RepID=A0AAD7J5N2_9AGAR|nr:hypothetical protein DFH07DRAFT_457413 [Mycena maculata]